MIIECNRGLWLLSEDSYHEVVRRLAHGEAVNLPDLGTRLGEIDLSIGSITREQAKKLYQQREAEKMVTLIKETK